MTFNRRQFVQMLILATPAIGSFPKFAYAQTPTGPYSLPPLPYAYDALRLGGAAYLAFLAWQSIKPGGRDIFAPQPLPPEPSQKLFAVGFLTAALNPKVALFYVAVLPPFIDPAGPVLAQGLILGATQIITCLAFDALLVWGSGGVSRFLATRPLWLAAQRWVLGAALALLAVKLATTSRA